MISGIGAAGHLPGGGPIGLAAVGAAAVAVCGEGPALQVVLVNGRGCLAGRARAQRLVLCAHAGGRRCVGAATPMQNRSAGIRVPVKSTESEAQTGIW